MQAHNLDLYQNWVKKSRLANRCRAEDSLSYFRNTNLLISLPFQTNLPELAQQ